MSLSHRGVVRSSFVLTHLKVPYVLVTPPRQPFHVISVQQDGSVLKLLQEISTKSL
jgi:hypothetical protein